MAKDKYSRLKKMNTFENLVENAMGDEKALETVFQESPARKMSNLQAYPIPVEQMHPFPDHPFKVLEDASIADLAMTVSIKPTAVPPHGHDFTASITATNENGKENAIEINTLIDREVSTEYQVGLYKPKDVTAVVYTNCDLEIHGNGAMKNYTSGLLPWEDNQILYLTWVDEAVSIETMDYWFEGNEEFLGARCSIPETVKTMIGCFEGCSMLTEAPDLSGAESLVDMTDCFSGCSSMQRVGVLPVNLKVADRTFYECTSMIYGADISKSNRIESMNECYAGDVSLVQSVTPDSVKYMESCYEGCINLKEGNIPVMVKDIESAWAGCFDRLINTSQIMS